MCSERLPICRIARRKGMTINKSDFILQLMEIGYTKKDASMLVDDFLDTIIMNLMEGNSVSFYGFGSFDINLRKARSCPHMITREPIVIDEHFVPKFSPGNSMKKAVRMWEASSKGR
jgi:nucleoid DNA-binding protein